MSKKNMVSKDLREYMEMYGLEIEDWTAARDICSCHSMDWREKQKYLLKLAEKTGDNVLVEEIVRCLGKKGKERVIQIPHPFHQGEAVRNIATEQYGIVMDKFYRPTDQIQVAVLEKGEWLPERGMEPCFLEFAELPATDERQKIFEAIELLFNYNFNM